MAACLALGPNHAGLPEGINDGVVDNGVWSAALMSHLVEGCKRSPPLAPLLVAADESCVGHHVWGAALALHLLKHFAGLLPLCPWSAGSHSSAAMIGWRGRGIGCLLLSGCAGVAVHGLHMELLYATGTHSAEKHVDLCA